MVVYFSLENIDEAAMAFLSAIAGEKVVAFHGEMGAGKTTFIHAVCECLQVKSTVSSPTFPIINEYVSLNGHHIFHMDLYRLRNEEEALNAGIEDALYSGNLCLVEWPEKAAGIFPENTIHCYLTVVHHNERKLQINL